MKRFLKQNIVILVLLNSGNLFNYLFQLVVGRCMSPADFGGFKALGGLFQCRRVKDGDGGPAMAAGRFVPDIHRGAATVAASDAR